MPEELEKWIESCLMDPDIWVLAWSVRPSVYSTISRIDDIILLRHGETEHNNFQLFIGNRQLRDSPVMRTTGDEGQQLDFRNSLCIQLVPSLVVRNILLKGSFGTLAPKEYHDLPEARQFIHWRKEAYRSFKEALSDLSIVATQLLADGTIKEWKDVIVSTGALEWFRKGRKLKEFPRGPVEFVPKPKLQSPAGSPQSREAGSE
jgi:hypothetical protein